MPIQHRHQYYPLFNKIKKLVAAGHLTQAVELYSINPDCFSATFLINHAHLQCGNLSLALSIYSIIKSSASKVQQIDGFVVSSLVYACQKLGNISHIPSLWKDVTYLKYFYLSSTLLIIT